MFLIILIKSLNNIDLNLEQRNAILQKNCKIDLEVYYSLEGGDPSAGSPTDTLLRLSPN